MKHIHSCNRILSTIHQRNLCLLPDFAFRCATKDLIPQIVQFRNKGAEQFEYVSAVSEEKELRDIEFFTSDNALHVLLMYKNEIIGAISALIQDDKKIGTSTYVSDLLVLKEFNSKGFATSLMALVEKWSIANNVSVVLSVYADNKNAYPLYKHQGFRKLEK